MVQTTAAKTAVNPEGMPPPPFRYSHAIRAGQFVFPSGQIASDFEDGVAPGTGLDPERPFHLRPVIPQTEWIYRRLGTLLEAAGSSLDNIVRLDQFFSARQHKPGYFPIKNRILAHDRPVSAALEMSGLLLPEAAVLVDAYAIVPGEGFTKRTCHTDRAPQIVAGHSMAIRAGDWVWTSGSTPTDLRGEAAYYGAEGTGLAPEARANPNFAYDYPIPKQVHYVVKKLKAYLEAAGSSLEQVVKAQAYLTDMSDFSDFNAIWQEYFPKNPPATLVAPLTRTGIAGGRLEVSLVALASGSTVRRETIQLVDGVGTLGHFPEAVRAGNLLFLSGQVAATSTGFHPAARVNPRQPYLVSPAKLETRVILDNIRRICGAAGGSIDSVVKAVFFFSDLSDVPSVMEEWGAGFGDDPPAVTIVQTTAPHLLPRCRITVDVYAAL